MVCSESVLRGRLKRSARAVQLFGRLAVLETHTRPLLKGSPTLGGGGGWVGLWPVGGWVSLVWGNLAQSAYPPPLG